MNFFGQNIFTILNIQIIVFSHLNIQTIALHRVVACSGFYRCLLDRLDILDDIWAVYHYNPLSHRPQYHVLQGVITVMDLNHKMWGMARRQDRAGINNDSQFTIYTIYIKHLLNCWFQDS